MSLTLPALLPAQYSLVYYFFLATAAIMACCFFAQLALSTRVMKWYRPAVYMSAFIVAVSAFHYIFIAMQWDGHYTLQGTMYQPADTNFLQALWRYAYWTPTVPLLLVSLVIVLNLSAKYTRSLSVRLALATVAMIALGYPGEIATDSTTRVIWGTISTLPFIYILYILWAELSLVEQDMPKRVAVLVRNSKILLLFAWGFFPLVYLVPFFGSATGGVEVGLQIGYAVADWVAKASFGFLIFAIAKAQSVEDELYVQQQNAALAAVAVSGD
jgi:bacteriorhodopsin